LDNNLFWAFGWAETSIDVQPAVLLDLLEILVYRPLALELLFFGRFSPRIEKLILCLPDFLCSFLASFDGSLS